MNDRNKKAMKKQLVTSLVCLLLLLLMLMTSTLAWFTDSSDNVNIMIAGKIDIDMEADFGDNLYIMPTQKIDKTVTVKNTGNRPCYVRTVFAFEDSNDVEVLKKLNLDDNDMIVIPGITNTDPKIQFTVAKDGVTTIFTVGYYIHSGELKGEDPTNGTAAESYTCLNSMTLDKTAGNEWTNAVGTHYEIFVLTQATQVTGLEGLSNNGALDEVFGLIKGSNAAKWFCYILNHDDRYTAGDLEAVVPEGTDAIVISIPVNP